MLGAYIHIPFCQQKCKYCDFNSYSGILNMSSLYVDNLIKEIETKSCKEQLDTIYIGGGTPTFIDICLIERVLRAMSENYTISNSAEITIECNPKTANLEKLKRLREIGLNRISIGLQTSDCDILESLGRIHSYEDFISCFFDAREAGFENISVDLMFGLPNQTKDIWLNSLKKVTELGPEHISCYSLKIEKGTPFYDMYQSGDLIVPSDDENRDLYDKCVEFLAEKGYKRYEISNFSKKGFESKHNLLYWETHNYLGFGSGAYSCIDGERFSNESGVIQYIEKLSKTGSAEVSRTKNNEYDNMCEFVFLGMRLDAGISKNEFQKRFNKNIFDVFNVELKKHIKMLKTIEDSGDILRIKPEYTYVSNLILSDFV